MRQTGPSQATVHISVDYTKAEIPDRAYYADYSRVFKSRLGLTLSFGKLSADEQSLRTKIEIVFPEQMFTKQLWGTTSEIRSVLDKIASSQPSLPPLGEVREETEKVQTFRANNVFIGVWGEEALLDFYYISPRDYYISESQRLGGDRQIALEPVIRVSMGALLMKEFFEQCEPLIREELLADVESDSDSSKE